MGGGFGLHDPIISYEDLNFLFHINVSSAVGINKIILENKKIKINRTLNIQKFIKKTNYKIKSWKTMLTEMKKFDEKSF